jgi:Flp pilus assembly protein TadG
MPASTHVRRQLRQQRPRRGAASVEFALVLPALIALTIGTMDVCSMLFLKETVVLAAYEGARSGVGRGKTDQDAIDRVIEFLDERDVRYEFNDVVTIDAPGFDEAETLENVTVNVSVPAQGNLLIPSQMFGEMTVTARVTMRKEYKNLDVDP